MVEVTTIKVHQGTKKRLDRLKEYNRESYDEVLKKVLHILNVVKKNPEKAQKIFKGIDLAIIKKEKYSEVYQEDEA